ncbi:MAG: EI24 domain-containing protein [Bradymonadia bacterium]
MSIFTGTAAYFGALGLMAKHPKLVGYALIPAAVTFGLSLAGGWLVSSYMDELIVSWLGSEGASGFFGTILGWIAGALSWLSVLFITPWLVMLIALPLCDPLIGATEAVIGGKEVEVGIIEGIVSALKSTILVLLVGLAGSIIFGMLGVLPGIGLIIAPLVMFGWTPLFLAFDLYDGSLSRRNLSPKGKIKAVFGRPATAWGLGIIASILVSIPMLNLIGLPLSVVAAVLVVYKLEQKGKLPA